MGHGIPTQNVLDRNATQFSLDILTQIPNSKLFLNMAPKRKSSSPTKGAKGTTPTKKNTKSPAVDPEKSKQQYCYKHKKVCYTADSQPPGAFYVVITINVYILTTTHNIRAMGATHCSMGPANVPLGRP